MLGRDASVARLWRVISDSGRRLRPLPTHLPPPPPTVCTHSPSLMPERQLVQADLHNIAVEQAVACDAHTVHVGSGG